MKELLRTQSSGFLIVFKVYNSVKPFYKSNIYIYIYDSNDCNKLGDSVSLRGVRSDLAVESLPKS